MERSLVMKPSANSWPIWPVTILFGSLAPCGDAAEFTGYIKSYALGVASAEPVSEQQFQSQNSLRLMLDGDITPSWSFDLHYELQPVYYSKGVPSEMLGNTITLPSDRYRVFDIDNVVEQSEHLAVYQNLDRASIRYSDDSNDMTMGRQVIAFGSARMVNPTDIFQPFAIQTLNQEYRVGIDALRWQRYTDSGAMMDMGYVMGEEAQWSNSAAFIHTRFSLQDSDIELTYIQRDDGYLIGGGLETSVGDSGVWFESAYANWRSPTSEHYWRASIGMDHALSSDGLIMIEYHFNGAADEPPYDLATISQESAYQQGGVYLLGRHYLIPALSWTISPLNTLQLSAFVNVSDQSVFYTLSNEHSWSDNLYSDIGLYLGGGDQGVITETDAVFTESEFGIYPTTMYMSLRYYF